MKGLTLVQSAAQYAVAAVVAYKRDSVAVHLGRLPGWSRLLILGCIISGSPVSHPCNASDTRLSGNAGVTGMHL